MTELAEQIIAQVQKTPGLTEEQIIETVPGDTRSIVQSIIELRQSGSLADEKGGFKFVPENERQDDPGLLSDHVPDELPDQTPFVQ